MLKIQVMPGVGAHAFNRSAREAEGGTGGLRAQGHPQLCKKLGQSAMQKTLSQEEGKMKTRVEECQLGSGGACL